MYDDDIFSFLNSMNSTTTETEQETTSVPSYNPQSESQTTYSPYLQNQDDEDDYSVAQNYEEQQSYNSINQDYSSPISSVSEQQSTRVLRQMETPMIQKEEPAVNLIKKRQRIELQARMKMVICVFAVVLASLIFAIAWNFSSIGKMKATFAGKQVEISQLQQDIMGLQTAYTSLSDGEQIKQKAEDVGYVDTDSDNTVEIKLEKVYDEYIVEDLPSNWFNDVCDFLSGIFS